MECRHPLQRPELIWSVPAGQGAAACRQGVGISPALWAQPLGAAAVPCQRAVLLGSSDVVTSG